jgi:hypothetical protein
MLRTSRPQPTDDAASPPLWNTGCDIAECERLRI